MKKFSAFLSEAQKSNAAKEAEQLKLTHIGYGRYADVRGNVTHMSKDGKLVKIDPGDKSNIGAQISGGEELSDELDESFQGPASGR